MVPNTNRNINSGVLGILLPLARAAYLRYLLETFVIGSASSLVYFGSRKLILDGDRCLREAEGCSRATNFDLGEPEYSKGHSFGYRERP